ncbi:MAG: CoA-binding protein [Phycisphaeraceae bacterium]|nr:CoA-binding protein [Phycisphaeraceae bacterium]
MVVGASSDRTKYGNKAVRAFLRAGNEVLPVNPRAAAANQTIEGLRVYPDIASVPGPIDKATIYVHPDQGFEVLDAIAARTDIAEVWLNPGAESPELLAHAHSLALNPIQACSIIAIGQTP